MLAIDPMLGEHLAAEEHALEVHREDAFEFFPRQLEDRCRGVHAGTVHEDVDAAAGFQDAGEQRLERGLVVRLAGLEERAASGGFDFGDARRGLVGFASDQHDGRAGGGQAFGHRAAEFAGAAGDDGDLAGQIEKRGGGEGIHYGR